MTGMLMPMGDTLPLFMMMGKGGGVGGTAAGAGVGTAGAGGAVGGAMPGGGGAQTLMPMLRTAFGGGGGQQQQPQPQVGPHPPGYMGPTPQSPPQFEPLGGAYKTGGRRDGRTVLAHPEMQNMPILGSHGWHQQSGWDKTNSFFDNMSPEARMMMGLGGVQQLMGSMSRGT